MSRSARGFTLIEMLVVLGIVGLLATMVLPLAEMTVRREREMEARQALWQIRDAIDGYRRARELGAIAPDAAHPSLFPATLDVLTQATPDARLNHAGEVLRFLRKVPRNPFADRQLPAEKTWGLRSYLSEADQPRPGDDVYDVYIPGDATALNGTPLKTW